MSRHQRNLRKRTLRRERNKLLKVKDQRLEMSPRMEAKKAAHQAYLDQIELDRLNGLETGRICLRTYREAQRKVRPRIAKSRRKGSARAADTYRGVRRNAERGSRRSLLLKAERLTRGITRSELDRRREEARRAAS